MVKLITGTDENGNNLSYNDTIHRLIEREQVNINQRNILVSHQFYLPSGRQAEDVERMDSEIRTGTPTGELPASSKEIYGGQYVAFDFDQMDRLYFATRGWSSRVAYFNAPARDYSKLFVDLRGAYAFGGGLGRVGLFLGVGCGVGLRVGGGLFGLVCLCGCCGSVCGCCHSSCQRPLA